MSERTADILVGSAILFLIALVPATIVAYATQCEPLMWFVVVALSIYIAVSLIMAVVLAIDLIRGKF